MATADEWAEAYARQAEADFKTWERLQGLDGVPDCHRLLFLQMACEKLTKAHLCVQGTDPETLQSSHAYTAETLPIVLRPLIAQMKLKKARWVNQHVKHIAQEVEVLAPAVKRGGQRPDNCEYPWKDEGGRLHVPLDWPFTPSGLLLAPAGRTFLNLVEFAIAQLLERR
jgi:hypothetical protein